MTEFLARIHRPGYTDPTGVLYYKLKCETYLFVFRFTDGKYHYYYYGITDTDSPVNGASSCFKRRMPLETTKENLESIVSAAGDLAEILQATK